MSAQTKPIRLVVICIAATILNPVLFGLVQLVISRYVPSPIVPYLGSLEEIIPQLMSWGICCWLAAKNGKTFTSWMVPALLITLIVLSRILGVINALGIFNTPDILRFYLYHHCCLLIYEYVAILIAFRSLGINFAETRGEPTTQYKRLSIKHFLLAATLVAANVTAGRWVFSHSSELLSWATESVQIFNMQILLIDSVSRAVLLGGIVWLLHSTRAPKLGWLGILLWLLSEAMSWFGNLILGLTTPPGLSIWQWVIISLVTHLIEVLAVIPLLKLFGYQFQVQTGSPLPAMIESANPSGPFDEA